MKTHLAHVPWTTIKGKLFNTGAAAGVIRVPVFGIAWFNMTDLVKIRTKICCRRVKLTTHFNLELPAAVERPVEYEPLPAFNFSAQVMPQVGYFFPPLE